jgi:hypothetical protein
MKSNCRLLRKGWLMGMVTLLSVGTFQAVALADQEAEDETYDLNIIDEEEGMPLTDVDFSIYRIGEVIDTETVVLEPEYYDACLYLELDDMDEWAADANTLDAYLMLMDIEGKTIEPVASGTTDANGALKFDDLEDGIYLITGVSTTVNQTIYTPSASLLLLTNEDTELQNEEDAAIMTQDLNDDETTVYVKNGSRPVRDESETVSFSAVKVWKDKDDLENRPTSVTLALLGDGKEYDRVILSEESNWRYTWSDMSPNVDWKLVEVDVPDEHTVTVVSDGTVFIVTNNKRPASGRLGDMASGDGIPSNPMDLTETSVAPETTTAPQVTTGGGTGDTSKIWELIPVLGLAGILLVLSGWGIYRKADNKHEK